MAAEMDAILGTWTYETSVNDDGFAAATGEKLEDFKKVAQPGTTVKFEKEKGVAGGYTMCLHSEFTGEIKTRSELGKAVENEMKFGEHTIKYVITTNYEGNGLWREKQINPRGKTIIETRIVKGDVLTITYTCDGVEGSSTYRKVEEKKN